MQFDDHGDHDAEDDQDCDHQNHHDDDYDNEEHDHQETTGKPWVTPKETTRRPPEDHQETTRTYQDSGQKASVYLRVLVGYREARPRYFRPTSSWDSGFREMGNMPPPPPCIARI